MIFIELVELALALLFLVVMVSQIVIPLARGSKLFPLFLKENKLEAELATVRQKKLEEKIKEKIKNEGRESIHE
jgi:hypothetical protein